MTLLQSFHPAANVAVIGASGGIGRELVQRLAADQCVARIFGFSRSELGHSSSRVSNYSIDLLDERTIDCAADRASADGALDLVIVATGLLHTDGIRPEKTIQNLDATTLARVYAVNAIGPALVAKHFLPLLRKGQKSVFAALSARVGSISDNRLGGWAAYRASKAALNMLLKTCAIEHARKFPESAVISLHPGTVDTALSKPFSARVPDERLFAADYAAKRLLGVIDTVTAADTGKFFAWDGSEIAF